MSLTKNNRQATKRNRYSVLSSFYNFSINTTLPALTNSCNSSVIKKTFKRPQAIQWQVIDKEIVDEIIFRTTNVRNRLMLELMARGGMRVGEVLKIVPTDIQERTLAIQNPKSGRSEETEKWPHSFEQHFGNLKWTLCPFLCRQFNWRQHRTIGFLRCFSVQL